MLTQDRRVICCFLVLLFGAIWVLSLFIAYMLELIQILWIVGGMAPWAFLEKKKNLHKNLNEAIASIYPHGSEIHKNTQFQKMFPSLVYKASKISYRIRDALNIALNTGLVETTFKTECQITVCMSKHMLQVYLCVGQHLLQAHLWLTELRKENGRGERKTS